MLYPVPFSMIINPYRFAAAAGNGYLLDDYAGATAAFSLRDLTVDITHHTDNVVVQVRRSSGSPTTDTFNATEVADGTMTAWVVAGGGAQDGFVQRWYDQTGNGNDAIELTDAFQAQIVDNGVLLSDGLLFNGTSTYYDIPTAIGTASAQSIFCVAQTSDLAGNRMLVDARDANDDGIGMFYLTSSDYMRFHVDTTDVFSSTSLAANTEYLFTGIYGSTTSTFYTDGTQTDTDATAPASSSATTDYHIGRGAYASSAFWQGSIQELIIYPTDETSNRTGIEGNINTKYSIY